MELLEKIIKRRSIRDFTDENISEDTILRIIEAGRWAPSGLNNQPWKFILVKDKNVKEEIASFTKYSKIIKDAKIIIGIFIDKSHSYHREKDIMAIGASIQNMLLMVEDLGYGACWLGEILNRRKDVEKALKAGDQKELMAVLAIGKPKVRPETTSRFSISEIFSII